MASDETFSNTKALPRGKLFTTQSRILRGNTSYLHHFKNILCKLNPRILINVGGEDICHRPEETDHRMGHYPAWEDGPSNCDYTVLRV